MSGLSIIGIPLIWALTVFFNVWVIASGLGYTSFHWALVVFSAVMMINNWVSQICFQIANLSNTVGRKR